MLHPAKSIDVPVVTNGRNTSMKAHPDSICITFNPKLDPAVIVPPNIRSIVLAHDKVGITLERSQCVVPRTVKPVRSIVLTAPRLQPDDQWLDTLTYFESCKNTVDCRTAGAPLITACERTNIHLVPPTVANADGAVVVWQTNRCHVIDNLKAAVLQRTTGGMSTYDVHLIPRAGDIVTVDMLPHRTLAEWSNLFGDNLVVDAGADPVHPRYIEHAQTVPSVHEFLNTVAAQDTSESSSSDDDSQWDGSESDSSSSSGSDYDLACSDDDESE